MHLSTHTKAGVTVLTLEDAGKWSGKAFGSIKYDLGGMQYVVTTRFNSERKSFYTRKAAEYFALAMAYEYLELSALCRDLSD